MPRDLKSVSPTPLTELEEYQLKRLLDRKSANLPEELAKRDRERAKEAKLQAKRDRMAAAEARLSKRLAELRIDIDVVSAEIYKIAPSSLAYRHVRERLEAFGDLVKTQSFFNTPHDTIDREHLMLLGELALDAFTRATKPKAGKTLRERMEGVEVKVGPDGPNGQAPDDRAALAAAIIQAGKRRRNEV